MRTPRSPFSLLLFRPVPRARSLAVVLACLVASAHLAVLPLEAQERATLARTLDLPERGITLRYAPSWVATRGVFANATELRFAPQGETVKPPFAAKILLTTERRLDHADAVERLRKIESDYPSAPATYLLIGGWPAMQRSVVTAKQVRGEEARGPNGPPKVVRVTTAIAVAATLVRVEGTLPVDAPPEIVEQAFATGRSLTFREQADPEQSKAALERLRVPKPVRSVLAPSDPAAIAAPASAATAAAPGGANSAGFTPQSLQPGSEIEMVSSNDGLTIVVASQNLYRTSNDGGFTFPFSGSMPFSNFGDPSLAIGASGTVYFAGIRNTAGCGSFGCATGIAASTDQGQTFTLRTNAVVCPSMGAGACFPDQEHIAADRVTAGGGGDQVYSTWRNFDSTDQDPALVCSQDGGNTWSAPITVGSGFVPRITVGQDGFVYVIYRSGGNIMLHKYGSCATGLTPVAGFPKTVVAVTDVTCPVPGLDRCNDGNILSSHMVVVDDLDANHVYVVYAENIGAGNERVMVRDSIDGGVSWPDVAARRAVVSPAIATRRFMPWVCATNGRAYVSWYDRRFATTTNDQTDFFAASAARDGGGNLVAGAEVQITNVSDPQCAPGWPCGTRASGDSEQCTIQPQAAGFCCAPGPNCPGSQQRCDFSDGGCPVGETCSTGGGCPKYGDYNGNACAAGRFYVGWASATPPTGIPVPPAGIRTYFASVVNQPPVAYAGTDQTVECSGNNQATVSLDGTGSTDGDGFSDIQSFAWSEGATPLASGPMASVPFSLGPPAHTVSLDVLDRARDGSSDTLSVNVVDTTPPSLIGVPPDGTVECDAVPPPASVSAADVCDPDPSLGFLQLSTQTNNGTCSDQNYTVTRTWTATDGTGLMTAAMQTLTVQDTTPPTVSMILPANDNTGLPSVQYPIYVKFTSVDNCAAKHKDRVRLSWRDAPPGVGCTLLDGNLVGDRDGMLTDESSLQITKYTLCQAMARCGYQVLHYPTVVAESTDPCGNTGSARRIIRLRLLRTEVCAR